MMDCILVCVYNIITFHASDCINSTWCNPSRVKQKTQFDFSFCATVVRQVDLDRLSALIDA